MWTQFFSPKPTFTEKNVLDLTNKVVDRVLSKKPARILYSKNAEVYVAASSEDKAIEAIEDIKKSYPSLNGTFVFLHLDLNDLSAIKASVEKFISIETKLNILFNDTRAQNLKKGANTLEATSVTWGTKLTEVKSIGLDIDNLDYHNDKSDITRYALIKHHKADVIISDSLNPGNLMSDLYHTNNSMGINILINFIGHPHIEVIPFRRIAEIFKDLQDATRQEAEGGNGNATKF
ncbi:hypothetical protein HD806DRAFT_525064 [Xylariaceae sp. AK1471]|nr:hypothetical protein HD806DRAFT_525064 [Xylariaceae sp. AK1471]